VQVIFDRNYARGVADHFIDTKPIGLSLNSSVDVHNAVTHMDMDVSIMYGRP
jgi:hypothetical protein